MLAFARQLQTAHQLSLLKIDRHAPWPRHLVRRLDTQEAAQEAEAGDVEVDLVCGQFSIRVDALREVPQRNEVAQAQLGSPFALQHMSTCFRKIRQPKRFSHLLVETQLSVKQ